MSAVALSASQVREQVILEHLPQVRIIAAKLHRRCPPEVLLEDLVSVGVLGLLDAFDRFDPDRKLKFRTLAQHRVRGAMLDYLRQLDPLPRAIRKFQKDRDKAMVRLSASQAEQVSEGVVAAELGLPLAKYRELARIAEAGAPLSLDSSDPRVERIREIPDRSAHNSNGHAMSLTMEAALRTLPHLEYTVIAALRSGDSARLIAQRLHVSEGRISQIKMSAIRRIRGALGVRTAAGYSSNELP